MSIKVSVDCRTNTGYISLGHFIWSFPLKKDGWKERSLVNGIPPELDKISYRAVSGIYGLPDFIYSSDGNVYYYGIGKSRFNTGSRGFLKFIESDQSVIEKFHESVKKIELSYFYEILNKHGHNSFAFMSGFFQVASGLSSNTYVFEPEKSLKSCCELSIVKNNFGIHFGKTHNSYFIDNYFFPIFCFISSPFLEKTMSILSDKNNYLDIIKHVKKCESVPLFSIEDFAGKNPKYKQFGSEKIMYIENIYATRLILDLMSMLSNVSYEKIESWGKTKVLIISKIISSVDNMIQSRPTSQITASNECPYAVDSISNSLSKYDECLDKLNLLASKYKFKAVE